MGVLLLLGYFSLSIFGYLSGKAVLPIRKRRGQYRRGRHVRFVRYGARTLSKSGIRAEAIHGNKSQNARQRALTGFKNHELRVLIATDIAARGIDVDQLSHVINYELPNIPDLLRVRASLSAPYLVLVKISTDLIAGFFSR